MPDATCEDPWFGADAFQPNLNLYPWNRPLSTAGIYLSFHLYLIKIH